MSVTNGWIQARRPVGVGLVCLSLLAGCGQQRDEPDPYDMDFDIPRSESFAPTLAAYGLYLEPLDALEPADGALLYELSSELFTDYAYKQRLMKVPESSTIALVNGDALVFPEGTIIAKTFYYPADMRDTGGPTRVIETRLLVKTAGVWNVATYLWNAEQTEATLLLDGTTTAVSWIDGGGQSRGTDYVVPHEGECVTCHQSAEASALVGPTLRNLNRTVSRDGKELNQLAHLVDEGVLDDNDYASAPALPNYRDESLPLANRARAYLDINCAHCHNPDGWDDSATINVDFRFATPLSDTGIDRKAEDLARVLDNGDMPYLGTTLRHDDGVQLVLDYLNTL